MRTRNITTAFLLLLALSTLYVAAQPTYFMIGCDYVHHRTDQWAGIRDTFDLPFTPALQRARSLGLNTVMIHPVGLTGYDTLVQKLVTKSHDAGMRTIIHDDSLRQLTIGERRIYQAEEFADFSFRGSQANTDADASFDDGENFDLLAEKRSNPPPRPANIIRLTPGVTQNGLVLSGFTHRRELHRDSLYYLSIKLRLAGTTALQQSDTVLRIVFNVNNTMIDTSLVGNDFYGGSGFNTDVREVFLGAFRIDSIPTVGFRLRRLYQPRDSIDNPVGHDSDAFFRKFTISDTCKIDIKVYYSGHGVVHIDQINLSDYRGWGMFVGDGHALPGDALSRITPFFSFS